MNANDDDILRGLQSFDADVTKEYFYGYCRRAYRIYDHKYQLQSKVGLDFYSLAHEYYIHLMTHQFKPLLDKPRGMKLSTWMTRGFGFVVLDALKAYNKEFEHQAIEASDAVWEYVRSTDREEGMMYQVADAVAAHYNDRIMQELAYEFFVLGYKQNEISKQLGLTPSAINQRYKRMMEEVVTPFIIENYGQGLYAGKMTVCKDFAHVDACIAPSRAPMSDMLEECFMPQELTYMEKTRVTPPFMTSLKENEIFVFGSNLHGIHAGGAARMAHAKFGAVMGNGVGLQGQSYAIPTMQGGVETIKPYVNDFLTFASQHPELHFFVTPIGCGIAGFEPDDIAPLFEAAEEIENVSLPEEFWEIIDK